MATYLDLLTAAQNDGLRQKVQVACTIAANTVMSELTSVPNHAARLAWAKSVYESPENAGRKMLWAVIAQNSTATLAQITGAADATIQTNVNAAIDLFAV